VKVYGLTGGIGSGKSTVARMLRDRGAEIIDADQVARAVVQPGSDGLAQVLETFGAEVLDPSGALDRKKLGARVFGDEPARKRLEAITHPLIAAETARRLRELSARGVDIVIYEAALLVQNGAHRGLDGLINVEAAPDLRRDRIQARDGLAVSDALQRIGSQGGNQERLAAADVTLSNDGSLEALSAQVDRLWTRLRTGPPLRDP
jgi:dephospho-CoA kinase